MALDFRQLRDLVIVPTLDAIGLNNQSAVSLLLMTAATESCLGTYIRQLGMSGNRGAFGIYQMEDKTYNDLWERMVNSDTLIRTRVFNLTGYTVKPPVQRMMTDMTLATIMTRLHYFQYKCPLPAPNDIEGLAKYWKIYYNSNLGKGTVEGAMERYKQYCT